MSAAAPNPSNLILLAGLGIGTYWLLTRRAQAAPAMQPAPQQAAAVPSRSAQNIRAATGLLGALGGLFGAGRAAAVPLLGTYDGRAAAPWDVTPYGDTGPRFNNPSAYTSSALDGVAFNPTTAAPWDAVTQYLA